MKSIRIASLAAMAAMAALTAMAFVGASSAMAIRDHAKLSLRDHRKM